MKMPLDAARPATGSVGSVIPRASLTGLGPLLPARNPIEKDLVAIWERVLNVAPLGVEDRWFDLGGDSLDAAVLFAEIEARFCKMLPPSRLLEAHTVAKLAALIERPAVRNEAAPIFNAAGKLPALYCIHGLTGSAEFARRLAFELGPEQPVIGFQALYSAGEAVPQDTVPAMATEYMEILRRHRPRGPYRLLGWCAGSLIALEMAQQLSEQGEEIARLIAVDPPVRRDGKSGASGLQETVRHLRRIDTDATLRNAMLHTAAAIARGSSRYGLRPYAGEIVLLCSTETCDDLVSDTSEWRTAAKGRLIAAKIAPTHMSIVEDRMRHLSLHVRHLLATVRTSR